MWTKIEATRNRINSWFDSCEPWIRNHYAWLDTMEDDANWPYFIFTTISVWLCGLVIGLLIGILCF